MFTFPTGFFSESSLSAAAAAYIQQVEAADGQALESGVKAAISGFVAGCQSDGIWDAIKACCILAGARTLAGALVPLIGPAPTNSNFLSADYNRKLGLKGNGTSKMLNTNCPHNISPQNNVHISVFLSEGVSSGSIAHIGVASGSITALTADDSSPRQTWVACDTGSSVPRFTDSVLTGFKGVSRNDSATFNRRANSVTTNVDRTASATPPGTGTYTVFARSGLLFSPARISFYSIGDFIDLALLDSRVNTLLSQIASAIP